MESTKVEEMKTTKLLDELRAVDTDKEDGMNRFSEVLDEIEERVPFESIGELEKRVDGIQHAVDKLKRHSHADGRVVVAI